MSFSPDNSMPAPSGCRPWAFCSLATERRPGPAAWTNRALSSTASRSNVRWRDGASKADGQPPGAAGELAGRRLDDELRNESVQDLRLGGWYTYRLSPRLRKGPDALTGETHPPGRDRAAKRRRGSLRLPEDHRQVENLAHAR